MGNAVRGYKGPANDSSPSILCWSHDCTFQCPTGLGSQLSDLQVVDLIFSDVQKEQEYNDLEEEVSEEEHGE